MAERAEERVMKKTVAAGELDAPYQVVFGDVSKIVDAARDSATRSVNAAMTAAYCLIGHRIVEFEQSGEERATYGTALMERLAADLTQRFGRGFSRQNIQYMRLFYVSYPSDQIRQHPQPATGIPGGGMADLRAVGRGTGLGETRRPGMIPPTGRKTEHYQLGGLHVESSCSF